MRFERIGHRKGYDSTAIIFIHTSHTSMLLGVSENGGTPKSSILIGFSIINHQFWGTPIFGNTHVVNATN